VIDLGRYCQTSSGLSDRRRSRSRSRRSRRINVKAYWREHETTIATREDLDEVTRAIMQSGEPTMLFMENDVGETLVVGLGRQESVLTFVEPDGTSFHSLGDPTRSGTIPFWCRSQLDDFLTEMAVPEALAKEAASEFLVNDGRPRGVQWEADW
jgi:hypothetical protein